MTVHMFARVAPQTPQPLPSHCQIRRTLAYTPPAPPVLFDWQADDDGPLTALDAELCVQQLERASDRPSRDAARKLRRYLHERGVL